MGICNHDNCASYSRNNRDRGECTENPEKLQDLYFVSNAEDKVRETNAQQLFDMVHCTLLHPRDSTTTSASAPGKGKQSKFVTEVGDQQTENEQKGNGDEQKDGNGTSKGKESKSASITTSAYGFGTQFKYHNKKHKMYIEPKV